MQCWSYDVIQQATIGKDTCTEASASFVYLAVLAYCICTGLSTMCIRHHVPYSIYTSAIKVTEQKILLVSIKLYSAADDDEQLLKKRKVQWWEYWADQHSSLWFAADCAVYCYRANCLSGLFWFAEQLLRSTVFSVLVFIRSHRTIHEPVPERKPVPCIRIVQTSVVAITSIHTRASSLVAVGGVILLCAVGRNVHRLNHTIFFRCLENQNG